MIKCLDTYKNIFIQQVDSLKVSPCCLAPTEKVTTDDLLNNNNLVKIRNQMQNGIRPAECSTCWNNEDLGVTSRRLDSNSLYESLGYDTQDLELISIDYWVGNICNLKCVICGPENSSAWQQELDPGRKNSTYYDNEFWKKLDLTKLRQIHFNGGEPFLSKSHVEFLKAIPNKSQVSIGYNTNGTILPSEELFSLWTSFKVVNIVFSIDDTGERFEYIRYPANWIETISTIQKIKETISPNIYLHVLTAIGLLNIFSYPETVQWFENNLNLSEYRWQWTNGILSCQVLPVEYEMVLRDIYKNTKFEYIIKGIKFNNNANLNQQITYLRGIEFQRKNDYKKIFQNLI